MEAVLWCQIHHHIEVKWGFSFTFPSTTLCSVLPFTTLYIQSHLIKMTACFLFQLKNKKKKKRENQIHTVSNSQSWNTPKVSSNTCQTEVRSQWETGLKVLMAYVEANSSCFLILMQDCGFVVVFSNSLCLLIAFMHASCLVLSSHLALYLQDRIMLFKRMFQS